MSRQRLSLAVLLALSCQRAAAPAVSAEEQAVSGEEAIETRGLAPGSKLAGVSTECGTYATLERGTLQLMNNVFAREQARGPWEQCLLRRELGGKEQLGWTWSWPGFLPSSFGFPELIVGWKPWSPRSTDARLPVPLANVQGLDVRYAVHTEGSGKHSLALAAWLTNSGEVASNPLAIQTEVVVWLDHAPGMTPAAERIASVILSDQRYDLWYEPNHGDRGDRSGWDLYYFQALERRRSGIVQLLPFLDYLRQAGRLQPESFVASVEFGNELMGGSGTTWVEDYEVLLTSAGVAPPEPPR